jgi:hypothetical protein
MRPYAGPTARCGVHASGRAVACRTGELVIILDARSGVVVLAFSDGRAVSRNVSRLMGCGSVHVLAAFLHRCQTSAAGQLLDDSEPPAQRGKIVI